MAFQFVSKHFANKYHRLKNAFFFKRRFCFVVLLWNSQLSLSAFYSQKNGAVGFSVIKPKIKRGRMFLMQVLCCSIYTWQAVSKRHTPYITPTYRRSPRSFMNVDLVLIFGSHTSTVVVPRIYVFVVITIRYRYLSRFGFAFFFMTPLPPHNRNRHNNYVTINILVYIQR